MTQNTIFNFLVPSERQIDSCRTTMDKVRLVYMYHQEAVNEDHNLLRLYEKYFGTVKYSEDIIKRTGRSLRNTKKEFIRDLKTEIVARRQQQNWTEIYL